MILEVLTIILIIISLVLQSIIIARSIKKEIMSRADKQAQEIIKERYWRDRCRVLEDRLVDLQRNYDALIEKKQSGDD